MAFRARASLWRYTVIAPGASSVPDLTFFIALSFFRFASIAQGVYKRSLQGNAADARAALAQKAAIVLAQEGWRIAEAAG